MLPKIKIRTIKTKLQFAFFSFLIILVGIVLLSLFFSHQETHNQQILSYLANINLDNQKAKRLERDFWNDESINPKFYERGGLENSEYLLQRRQSIERIRDNTRKLGSSSEIADGDSLLSLLTQLRQDIDHYEYTFDELVKLIRQRGFKDYGLEGKMRFYIHRIEELAPKYQLDLGKLLMIRRHEKDFFLRKEKGYLEKSSEALAIFRQEMKQKVISPEMLKKMSSSLRRYQETFKKLVLTEEEIGFNNKQGKRKVLNELSQKIEDDIQQLSILVRKNINSIQQSSRLTYGLVLLSGLVLFISLGVFLSRKLSRPIQQLSSSITEAIAKDFDPDVKVINITSQDEIGLLSQDFAFMLQKTQENIKAIADKSERIEQKQRLLLDSLNYAQRIQQAMLPNLDKIAYFFPDYGLIYRPMHVVSGDFYWLTEVNQKVFVAVVDCTGHGVPGAFMSMIANSLLNKIVKEKHIHDPSFVLEVLDLEIRTLLRQDETQNDDGLEISLCVIDNRDQNPKNVLFSGAKSSIFHQSEGEIFRYKGDSRAIGGINYKYKITDKPNFTNTHLELKSGDTLFMCSDGVFDQPNPKRKKFGKKKFMKLLKTLEDTASVKEKVLEIELKLDEHAEGQAARDDITLLALGLPQSAE